MDSEEERPVFHVVTIQTILTAGEVERADEGPFIGKQCSINEFCSGAMFYYK